MRASLTGRCAVYCWCSQRCVRTTAIADDGSIKPSDLRVLEPAGSAGTPPRGRCSTDTCSTRRAGSSTPGARPSPPSRRPRTSRSASGTSRAFFLQSLGDLPVRTPLNTHVVGTLRRDGYHVEKVIFESRPGHHVTANFYVPHGKPPYPGVLLPCGHSDNGKAYEQYQRVAILLAKSGMAVLCYDPIGQGERYQRLDDQGKPVVRGTTEHTMAGIGALLVGRQEASYRIWDGLRALDYLAGRPEVDPRRLGCTGNSGGGTLTAYLMALDDRIAVAAPSCYITSLERLFATIGPQDAEQNITGQVAAGMEHADYLTLRGAEADADDRRHPRLLRHPGELGYIPRGQAHLRPAGLRRAGRPLRVGRAARVHASPTDRHRPMDVAMAAQEGRGDRRARFLDRVRRRPAMHEVGPGPPRLQGSIGVRPQRRAGGRVAHGPQGAGSEAVRRRSPQGGPQARWACGDRAIAAARPRVVGTFSARGRTIRKLAFDVEPGIIVPALDIAAAGSDRPAPSPVVVKAGVDWGRDLAGEGAIDELLKSPGRIVLINPRGMGETDPGGSDRREWPFGSDWKEAFLAHPPGAAAAGPAGGRRPVGPGGARGRAG